MKLKSLKNILAFFILITGICLMCFISVCAVDSVVYVSSVSQLEAAFEKVNTSETGGTYLIKLESDITANNVNFVIDKADTQVYFDLNDCKITGNNVSGAFFTVKKGELIVVDSGNEEGIISALFDKTADRSVIRVESAGALTISDAVIIRVDSDSPNKAISVDVNGKINTSDCYIVSEKNVALNLSETAVGIIDGGCFRGRTPIMIKDKCSVKINNCATYSYDTTFPKRHIDCEMSLTNVLSENSAMFDDSNNRISIDSTTQIVSSNSDRIFVIGDRYCKPMIDSDVFNSTESMYYTVSTGEHTFEFDTRQMGYWDETYLKLSIKKEVAFKDSEGNIGEFNDIGEFKNYNFNQSEYQIIYSLAYYRGGFFLHRVSYDAFVKTCYAPVITKQPENAEISVNSEDLCTFSFEADKLDNATYEWILCKKDGTAVSWSVISEVSVGEFLPVTDNSQLSIGSLFAHPDQYNDLYVYCIIRNCGADTVKAVTEKAKLTVTHDYIYDEKTDVTLPTCISQGNIRYHCTGVGCGSIKNTQIDKTDHSDTDSDGKCDTCSKILALSIPKNVKVTQTTSSVTLTWEQVQGASGYRVFKQVNGRWKTVIKATGKLTVTISNLNTGTKYNFAVRAYNNGGTDTIWAEKYVKIKTATQPAAVKSVTATSSTSSAKITWSKSAGATGYRIFYRTSTKKSWKVMCKATSSTLYNATGLPSGTAYQFAVRPYINTGTQTVWSPTYTSVFVCTKPKNPVAKVTSATKGKVKLSWNSVSGASGYQVYYKKANGSWKFYKTVKKPTEITFSCSSGVKYYYAVRAYRTLRGVAYRSGYNAVSVKVK